MKILADCLNAAVGKSLDENKSPSRKVNELDNRGSHFYLALFWAEALACQDSDIELKDRFSTLASTLRENEQAIIRELNDAQGEAVDLGGYYLPDEEKASAAMRPSALFNEALASLSKGFTLLVGTVGKLLIPVFSNCQMLASFHNSIA